MKVWESPFIPSHLTFEKFQISLNQSHNNSNKQTNLSIYYNIPKFSILGCYKPTTLKMNLVLEIRRGQQEIGQVRGLLKIHRSSQGFGVLPPLKAWLRFHQNSYTPSLFLTVSVFSNLQYNSFLGSSGSGITFFSRFLCPFFLVRLYRDWVSIADGSGANTKQILISHSGQQFMVSPAGNGSGLILTV